MKHPTFRKSISNLPRNPIQTHLQKPQMAIRASFLSPQIVPKPTKFTKQLHPIAPFFLFHNGARKPHLFLCSGRSRTSDADLAAEFASEVSKAGAPLQQRKEAMKKSREILFGDLCQYNGLGAEEMKKRWREMDEEERLKWLTRFVADWGLSFHPLSLKSVKEMVDEHLAEESPPPISSSVLRFPDFLRMMKFS